MNFDNTFFGIREDEVMTMSPNQRMILEDGYFCLRTRPQNSNMSFKTTGVASWWFGTRIAAEMVRGELASPRRL